MSLAGTAVGETQERLVAVADAAGAPGARIVALPTVLFVSFGRDGWATIEPIPQFDGSLRLDQISELYALVDDAERGAIGPVAGLRRLEQIHDLPPRRGWAVSLAAYVVMTAGLCLVLQPTPADVAVSSVFGLLVGALVLVARGRRGVTALVPVLSAIIISALSFEAVKLGFADPGLRTLIAPLVVFLPGGVLATATVELASGEMLAGASRLVFGAVQLTLLAFGIVVGVELAGLPSEVIVGDTETNLLGAVGSLAGGRGLRDGGERLLLGPAALAAVAAARPADGLARAGLRRPVRGRRRERLLRRPGDDPRRPCGRAPARWATVAGHVPAGVLAPGAGRAGADRHD